jgi:hypothetical protein
LRRPLLALAAVLVAGAVAYQWVLRDEVVSPQVDVPRPAASLGPGPDAVGIGPDGDVLAWLPPPEEGSVPQLPAMTPPKGGRLSGPMLQQARVLGAAPAALRPHLASSFYGESGVDVELRSGVELRFGDASNVGAKWSAAAAVLADPSIAALDYVDLHAPSRPAVGGSGHLLPPVP